MKDVLIVPLMEECALGMVLSKSDAAGKGAQIDPSKGECASDMGHNTSDAAMKDVKIML